MTRPFPITLAMVAYNKFDTVDLSIESAAKGSMRPDMLVISDDGSSDTTVEVAEETAAKCGIPCRVIRNLRVGRFRLQTMRNICISNALNGVVYLSDSDCIFGEHSIESHYEIHRQARLHNRSAVGTGPRYEYLQGNSGPFTSTYATLEYAHFPDGHYCVPVGANFSFQKLLWKRIGGFDRAYEGFYGMDEFQFSQSAEMAGAECVADPGAYVFHIPHDTLFGNRSAMRNIGLFNETYHRDHIAEEHLYVEQRVMPWYWRGNRKRPILGDRVGLDEEWGAPEGFVPPLHLALSRSLRPLIDPVERWLDTRDPQLFAELRLIGTKIEWRKIGQTSPAFVYLTDLHYLMHSYENERDLLDRMKYWLEGATAVDAEMRARAPEVVLQ